MLLPAGQRRNFDLAQGPQPIDDVLDQHLGRGGARGNTDRVSVFDPLGRKLAAIGDEIAWNARLRADFAQPIGIGTILGADDQNHIDVIAEFPHRRLAVLWRIARGPDLWSHAFLLTSVWA